MLKPVLSQQLAHGKIGVRLRVVIRQNRVLTPHRGGRLELQAVARQVLGAQYQTLLDRVKEFFLRLTRQAVHQIETDVIKALLPRQIHRGFGLLERMDTPNALKLILLRRLHAEGQTVDAVFFHRVKHFFIRALRIALDRDFRIVRQREFIAHLLQNTAEIFRPQTGRCAAANIYGIYRVTAACPSVFPDMRQQRRNIAFHQVRVGHGIKIAVGALFHAERNVQVQPQRPIVITELAHDSSSSFKTAMNASVGICTVPSERIFFLPSFCFSSSFFLRVMSPP